MSSGTLPKKEVENTKPINTILFWVHTVYYEDIKSKEKLLCRNHFGTTSRERNGERILPNFSSKICKLHNYKLEYVLKSLKPPKDAETKGNSKSKKGLKKKVTLNTTWLQRHPDKIKDLFQIMDTVSKSPFFPLFSPCNLALLVLDWEEDDCLSVENEAPLRTEENKDNINFKGDLDLIVKNYLLTKQLIASHKNRMPRKLIWNVPSSRSHHSSYAFYLTCPILSML